jgi:hypothetical protein
LAPAAHPDRQDAVDDVLVAAHLEFLAQADLHHLRHHRPGFAL